MRYVLDTDMVIAGFRSPRGASRRVLELAHQEAFEVVVSVAMMLEYEAVLKRPQHLQAAKLSVEDIDDFLDSLAMIAIPVTHFFLWRPQLKDPNDEMVLEAAVNGQADAIVSFNTKHLLAGAHRFGIELLQPSDALRRLSP